MGEIEGGGRKVKYYVITLASSERETSGRRTTPEERKRLMAQGREIEEILSSRVRENFSDVSVEGLVLGGIYVMVYADVAEERLGEMQKIFPDCSIRESNPWQRIRLPRPPRDPDDREDLRGREDWFRKRH